MNTLPKDSPATKPSAAAHTPGHSRFVQLKRDETIDANTVGKMSNVDFLQVSKKHHGEAYSGWLGNPLGRLVETKAGKKAREESEANARLIAAAPTLLEALQAIIENCGDFGPGQLLSANRSLERIEELARAAIAKATGGTP